MNKTQKKIRRTGKIFSIILTIMMVIFIITAASTALVGLTILVLPDSILPDYLGGDLNQLIAELNDDEDSDENTDDTPRIAVPTDPEEAEAQIKQNLVDMINNIGNGRFMQFSLTGAAENAFSVKHLLLMLLFSFSLMCVFLTIYCSILRSMMKTLSNGERPFTIKAAKKLRRISLLMLLSMFIEPLSSIILFAVTLIFSYLFEYGAYLQEKADETNRIQEEMIMSFAEVTENKSEQTGKHVRRVAEYSKILAEGMGLNEDQTDKLRLASTMHDIGKLMIPTEILEKPARLTDEEFTVIKKHPGYGGKLLENVEGDVMTMAKTIALDHHERVDGRGYPDGKASDDISIEGKIVAVADVYDALTSKRSYKEPWDHEKAYEEILKGSGTQFDERVVEVFKRRYADINAMRQKYADEVTEDKDLAG